MPRRWIPVPGVMAGCLLGACQVLGFLPAALCANSVAPAPFGSFPPAPVEIRQSGYEAEWFVPPSAFNMPLQSFVSPKGELLVHAVRSWSLFRVMENGTLETVSDEVYGYLGDIDSEGNIYLHMTPDGEIYRISPDGAVQSIVHSNDLRSDCDSGFGIGPDGNLYLALNHCTNRADLFQITPQGKVTLVKEKMEPLRAIRTSAGGRLLGATWGSVVEISPADFSVRTVAGIPGGGDISPGGLAVDGAGNIFVSTGSRSTSGAIYKVDPKGKVTEVAKIPLNGLSGIAWMPETGEIVGGQIRQGGLIAVKPDGAIRELFAGNGLVTPMAMAFSPCGDLAVNNDDGGMMARADAQGAVSWMFDYISYVPPVSFVLYAPDGTLYTSEAAPGLTPVRVAMLPPGGHDLRTFYKADRPSGLARSQRGAIVISETSAGRIIQIAPDGSRTVVAEGLSYPQALAFDAAGNLFAITGMGRFKPSDPDHPPTHGDTVIRISPDGGVSTYARMETITGIAFGADGMLYAIGNQTVVRIRPDGSFETIAQGMEDPMGLAFDLAGNLYVSDARRNTILRLGGFPQGVIGGLVTDSSGQPVPNARIRVLSEWPIVAGSFAVAGADGRFSLPAAPRIYSVTVNAAGYASQTITDVEVAAGTDRQLEIVLKK